MRVIAGSARRTQLKTVQGLHTRPTTDRIKETLFNILQPDLYGAVFLDLFSGSGAIGIEALSRGSQMAVFVDNNKQAVSCIRDNLKATKLSEKAEVYQLDANAAIRKLQTQKKCFDIIFMDPPYHLGVERSVLEAIRSAGIANEDTLIIVEADLNTDFSYLETMGYCIRREKQYKTNKHLFLGIDNK